MKKGIILALGLAIGGAALLTGCKSQQYNIPIQPKWQGAPYHISFDTQATKPSPAGITIPIIKYTANPDAVERRATLVMRIEPVGAAKDRPMMNQIVMGAVDMHGAEGALPADYMEEADKGLVSLLDAYGIKGKVKVSVLLAKSSINSQPGEDEINEKRLSDWLPAELDFKKPHRTR